MKLPFSLIVILTLTICGCVFFETNERRFLSHGQGHATQEEVRQRFGPPTLTKTAPSGEPVWVYQSYDWQPGSRVTAPGTWCNEYRLMFDDQRVLRRGGRIRPISTAEKPFQPTACRTVSIHRWNSSDNALFGFPPKIKGYGAQNNGDAHYGFDGPLNRALSDNNQQDKDHRRG